MHCSNRVIYFTAILALTTGVVAEEALQSDGPYAPIIMRNVFALDPPQPAKLLPSKMPVKIRLNGIVSIFGQPEVLFKVTDTTQAGHAPEEKSYILCEGESQDEVKVVHVDAIAGVVTFKNHGIDQTITLPDSPSISPLMPVTAAIDSNPHTRVVPGRIPPYLGGDPAKGTSGGSPTPMTQEQQILMIEAQRAYYNSLGDPESERLARSLPPTALTPADAQ